MAGLTEFDRGNQNNEEDAHRAMELQNEEVLWGEKLKSYHH